jgi:hypothetical protein
MLPNPQGYGWFIFCTLTLEYATLSLHVLGLGAVIHFFVSKPARYSVGIKT